MVLRCMLQVMMHIVLGVTDVDEKQMRKMERLFADW